LMFSTIEISHSIPILFILFKTQKKALFVRVTLIEFLVNGGSHGKGKT
jgi:hypothetical protein